MSYPDKSGTEKPAGDSLSSDSDYEQKQAGEGEANVIARRASWRKLSTNLSRKGMRFRISVY